MVKEKCRFCNGTGKELHTGITAVDKCHVCKGKGLLEGNYCKYCGDLTLGIVCNTCYKDFERGDR